MTSGDGAAQTAMAALKSGDTETARHTAEAGLKAHPDHPGLLQVLGLAALSGGDAAAAAEALKRCLDQRPDHPDLWEIYGGALEALGRHEEALSAYTHSADLAPDRSAGHRLRGLTLNALGRHNDAVQAFDKAIAIDADDAEAWFGLGNAQYALINMKDAEAALSRAVALRPEWAQAVLNRAIVRAEDGRSEEALADYQSAITLAPDDAGVFRQFAITLWDLQHIPEADRMFAKSLDLDPDSAATLANHGAMLEQTNRLDEARTRVDQALALDPDHWLANKTHAVLLRRSGETDQAHTLLTAAYEGAATANDKAMAAFELAQANDKLGQTDAAFALFAEANGLQAQSAAGQRTDPADYLNNVRHEQSVIETSPPAHQSLTDADEPPDPVFLMGFPRSGTTLLDQVLDSHPDAVVLDERPPLAEVHNRINALERQSGQPFTALDAEQREVARSFYFQRARAFVEDFAGKTLVDKHPLATARTRIIKLLFPRARIVFALRHPCDVVLSAFMQPFVVNRAMANFHTLDGAVETYATIMTLWQSAEPKLDLNVHYIRYEDLVQDFDNEVSAVLSFIGLPWDERVAAFHEHAKSRTVRTASARQVTQPLYTSALARWKRYERYLQPHLETLQPFIDAFGYSTAD